MPALIPLAITAGMSVYQIAHQNAEEKKARAATEQAMRNRPTYQTSPAISAMLADSQGRLNAVDPAVTAGYQQEQQAMANRIGAAQRSASSGAEALSAGSSAQTMLNQAAPGLIGQQSQYQQQRLQDYYRSLGAMSEQDQLKAQDALARYGDNFNYNLGLAGAANANKSQAIGLLGTSLASAANGLSGYKFGGGNPVNQWARANPNAANWARSGAIFSSTP